MKHDCQIVVEGVVYKMNIIWLEKGKRGWGRPRMTWSQVIEKDMRECGLKREDAKDRERCRRLLCRAAGQPLRKQGKWL